MTQNRVDDMILLGVALRRMQEYSAAPGTDGAAPMRVIENLQERATIAGDLDTVRFLMTALDLPIQEAILDRAQFALTGNFAAHPIYTRPHNGIGDAIHRFCRACSEDVFVDRAELTRKIASVSYTHLTLPTNREV